jgi:hypothetical protein
MILWVTKNVDMRFSRAFEQARLQVLVLDPDLIPSSVDMVIRDYIYELHFSVEPEESQDEPAPMEMDDGDDNNGSDDMTKGRKEDDKPHEEKMMVADDKNDGHTNSSSQNKGGQKPQGCQRNIFHIAALGWKENEEMNDVLSQGRIQQLHAISEASTSSRKSKRRTASADEHSLERAERIKVAKNLDAPPKQGNQTAKITFLNLSTEYVSHNLANLGMCLGNDTAAVHSTVTKLKDMELERKKRQPRDELVCSVFDKEEKNGRGRGS